MATPQHKNDSEEKHVVYAEDASQEPHSLSSSGDQEKQQPGKVIKSPEELAYLRKLNITVLPLMMAIIFVQVRLCICKVQVYRKFILTCSTFSFATKLP